MHYYHSIEPVRKAILIGCPGDKHYLQGVSKDLDKLKAFLCSPLGGMWRPDEILTLWDPGLQEVEGALEMNRTDYLFTYFSGHGFTDLQRNRIICLNGHHIDDLYLLNESPRQQIFIDACRNMDRAAIGGIEGFERPPFDGYNKERDLFNRWILNSPPGRKIIHGTGHGFAASDDSKRGGHFTLKLLEATKTIYQATECSPLFIEQILQKASFLLALENSKQVPEIVYEEGELNIPFALSQLENTIVQYPIYSAIRKSIAQPKSQSSGSNWVGPALLVTAALLVAAHSSD